MEPEADVKRNILQQKLQQFRARAYEMSVNAQVAKKLGGTDEAKKYGKQSDDLYEAARETRRLLDELPDEEGNEE